MPKLTDYLILDLATAPADGAAAFVEPSDAPENYGEEAAKKFRDKSKASKLEKCGLDPDLCQITGYGMLRPEGEPTIATMGDHSPQTAKAREVVEKILLMDVLEAFEGQHNRVLIGFNSFKFDLPVLMRRCLYLGLPMPNINLDRYRSPHVDLFNRLTHSGAITAHSLGFYAKRLGMTDITKTLTGEEESQVLTSGKWAELEQSLRHDVIASKRLAVWMGII